MDYWITGCSFIECVLSIITGLLIHGRQGRVSIRFHRWQLTRVMSLFGSDAPSLANSLQRLGQTSDAADESHGNNIADLNLGGVEGGQSHVTEPRLDEADIDFDQSCIGCDRSFSVVSQSPQTYLLCSRCFNLKAWLHGADGNDDDAIEELLSDNDRRAEFNSMSEFHAPLLDSVEPPKKKTKIVETESCELEWAGGTIRFDEINHNASQADVDLAKCAKFEMPNGRTFVGVPTDDWMGMPPSLEVGVTQKRRIEKQTCLNDGSVMVTPDQQDKWFKTLSRTVDRPLLPQMTQRSTGAIAPPAANLAVASPAKDQILPQYVPLPQRPLLGNLLSQRATSGRTETRAAYEARAAQQTQQIPLNASAAAPDQETDAMASNAVQRRRRGKTPAADEDLPNGGIGDTLEGEEDDQLERSDGKQKRKLSGLHVIQNENAIKGFILNLPSRMKMFEEDSFDQKTDSRSLVTLSRQIKAKFEVAATHFTDMEQALQKAHEMCCTDGGKI
jgi:hypothetical protein